MSLGNDGIYTVSLMYLHRQKSMGVWSGDLGRHRSKVGVSVSSSANLSVGVGDIQ